MGRRLGELFGRDPPMLISKIDLVTLFLDSFLKPDSYDQVSLCQNSQFNGLDALSFNERIGHFRNGSVNYGSKSRCGTEWKPFKIMQGREKRSWSINRNHRSLEYPVLIRGGSACLFFGQTGVNGATFLPVLSIFRNFATMQRSKW